MYQVIARKWRPQTFEEVVGQATTAKALQNAIRQGRLSHAYLFTGTRGVGKTSTARILAKALNCHENGPTPVPCGTCISCQEITRGQAVDVLEIDAASNRSVAEVRELRENVRYAPSRDRYKIFIIDEVHMLTAEAFNALLKTLEEPPPHVVFILATTELHKIPQTILSRCQQYDFRVVPAREVEDRLRRILDAEKFQLSGQALHFVAKASGGSMRDAESALQKIMSLGQDLLSDDEVAALLGVVRQDTLNRMWQAVADGNQPAILDLINDLYEKGHDLQNFTRAFLESIRHLLVFQVTNSDSHLPVMSPEDAGLIRSMSKRIRPGELVRYYELLQRSEGELRYAPYIRFHVEMAFLKLAILPRLASFEDLLAGLQQSAPAILPALASYFSSHTPAPAVCGSSPAGILPPGGATAGPAPPLPVPGTLPGTAEAVPVITPPPALSGAGTVITPGPVGLPADLRATAAPPASPAIAETPVAASGSPAAVPPGPVPDTPRPAGDAAADAARLEHFLHELPQFCPQLKAFLPQLQWRLTGHALEIMPPGQSIQDKTVRLASTQENLRRLYQELFAELPAITVNPRPPAPPAAREEQNRQQIEEQKRIESIFLKDPIARVLMDKLSGRWIFRPGE